jgi:hypothetical protein
MSSPGTCAHHRGDALQRELAVLLERLRRWHVALAPEKRPAGMAQNTY